ELGRYIKAGATNYFLVNTSDIRPVSMSIRAVMDAVWKGLPGDHPSDDFYQQWSSEEFGEKAASKLADLYKEYFNAPAHIGEPVHEYGDQFYHTQARRMMLTYMIDSPLYAIPSQAPKWQTPRVLGWGLGGNQAVGKTWLRDAIAQEIKQCGEAQVRWDAVWKKAQEIEALIPAERLPFYHAQVIAMIAINRESNRILFLIARAMEDAQRGNTSEAHQSIRQALASFDEIQRAEEAAEYDKWKHWYRGDWLTGIPRTRQMLETLSRFIDDPETSLAPPILWDGWEAYYHIMHYEGERSAEVK
ncbi:MAG: glycosyl hydrolase 115 family protein, partial [Acidobacteria bacterium]|nr:glycosyl hydrolase 115 family protein [Acidobacteriota bacterium]